MLILKGKEFVKTSSFFVLNTLQKNYSNRAHVVVFVFFGLQVVNEMDNSCVFTVPFRKGEVTKSKEY